MKRFLAFIIAVTMLVLLVSCSTGEGGKKKEEEGKQDLSQMSAQELYDYGTEKNKALSSAQYVTKVIGPEGEFYEIESVRIRSGYDGYSYSRSGNGYICFLDGEAYVENKNGKFTSSATTRIFEEYLAAYVFPLYGFDVEDLENLTRKENKVSYELKNKEILSLYKNVPLEGEIAPLALTGDAFFSEEGILLSEKLSLVTKSGEEEKIFLLESTLSEYRSDTIAIQMPQKGAFEAIQDIRIPEEILGAEESLLTKEIFHTAVVSSGTVSFGEKKYALNQDAEIYQITSEGAVSSYASTQTLKQFDGKPEESLFEQVLTEKGTRTENVYDTISGEKLSEKVTEEQNASHREEIEKKLLSPADLKNIVKEKTSSGQSYRFELTADAVERILKELLASLEAGGLPAATYQMTEAAGTMSVDQKSGILSSLTYSVSGTCIKDGEEGVFSARFSVFTDPKENVQIPGLQTPTPITPDMAEGGVD